MKFLGQETSLVMGTFWCGAGMQATVIPSARNWLPLAFQYNSYFFQYSLSFSDVGEKFISYWKQCLKLNYFWKGSPLPKAGMTEQLSF